MTDREIIPRFQPQPVPPPQWAPPTSAPTVAEKPGVLDTEPVALAGAIQAVLIALLAVLQGFGVTHLSQEQVSLLLALYVAVVAAGTGFARAKAWSPASVARALKERG